MEDINKQVHESELNNLDTYTGLLKKTYFVKDEFSIRSFQSNKTVTFPDGTSGKTFSVKGKFLPDSGLALKVTGKWEKSQDKQGKNRWTLNVQEFSEIRENTKEGIKSWLLSLKGVGSKVADGIFNTFGMQTYEILDEDISRLKEVKGIGDGKKFEKIKDSYVKRSTGRELFSYLGQYNVRDKNIKRIFDKYGSDAISEVRSRPYELYYKEHLIGFIAADHIGINNYFDRLDDSRVAAAIFYTLMQNESRGNTYITWLNLWKGVAYNLDVDKDISHADIAKEVSRVTKDLISQKVIVTINLPGEKAPCFMRKQAYWSEKNVAKDVGLLVRNSSFEAADKDYGKYISDSEKKLGITLSDEQRAAVATGIKSQVSVVTGGPGTGKTSFQKVLFDVIETLAAEENREASILLAAPTGKAARRMQESSGRSSQTIHQMLKIIPTDGVDDDLSSSSATQNDDVEISCDLLVIDEISMIDVFIAEKLFGAVQPGTRVVCVGDIFQLPSVGAGTVLKSLIESNVVPVTKFTKIFRQSENSSIPVNAGRINSGNNEMEYDKAFCFKGTALNRPDLILEYTKKYFATAIQKYGIDEVVVLSPFRRKTETGTDLLNPILKEIYNPAPTRKTPKNSIIGTKITVNDKVMYTKNRNDGDDESQHLSNGDTGYVKVISVEDNEQFAIVDFGKDRSDVLIQGDDLKNLVLAYAITIHKSQGSEYKCCLIPMDMRHRAMLKRNLIYTGVTRAKDKVILIGEPSAFNLSVASEDTSTRYTMLTRFLQEEASRHISKNL